jgi:hypothetical protein
MLKKKYTLLTFLLGALFMLGIIVAGSYIAMEREEWVYTNSPTREVDEINRILARENFIESLLTFPKRVIKGSVGTTAGGIYNIRVEDDWATVEGGPVDRYTCKFWPAGPGIQIYRKIHGEWQTINNRGEYEMWIKEVPETLVSPQAKNFL